MATDIDMFPVYNILLASLIALASYTFWVSSVPPTPPASATETKRPIPWLRIHAISNSFIACSFMLLSAYRVLVSSYGNDSRLLGYTCTPSLLYSSSILPLGAWLGYAILLLGGYIRITSQRTLGKFFTWEISLKKDHKLCTFGPYSVVRHPGYLGLWTVRIAIDIIQSSHGSFLSDCFYPRYPLAATLFIAANYAFTLSIFVWMAYRAKWEDDLMKKEFTKEWTEWAQRTPYRIVPYIY